MVKKNETIREHLAAVAQERISKNRFLFGAVQIKIAQEAGFIEVSIYNSSTDTDIIISSKVDDVTILNNALCG